MNIAENIAKYRKINKMTQEDLAEKCGVSRQAVTKWESGISEPDISKLCIMKELFSISLDELISGEEPKNDWNIPNIGEKLKKLREFHNASTKEIAHLTKIPEKRIVDFEEGIYKPSLVEVISILKEYDENMSCLIDGMEQVDVKDIMWRSSKANMFEYEPIFNISSPSTRRMSREHLFSSIADDIFNYFSAIRFSIKNTTKEQRKEIVRRFGEYSNIEEDLFKKYIQGKVELDGLYHEFHKNSLNRITDDSNVSNKVYDTPEWSYYDVVLSILDDMFDSRYIDFRNIDSIIEALEDCESESDFVENSIVSNIFAVFKKKFDDVKKTKDEDELYQIYCMWRNLAEAIYVYADNQYLNE